MYPETSLNLVLTVVKAASFKLNATSASMTYGGSTYKIGYTNNAGKVAFASGTPSVAKVSSMGVITAVKPGNATGDPRRRYYCRCLTACATKNMSLHACAAADKRRDGHVWKLTLTKHPASHRDCFCGLALGFYQKNRKY